MTTGSTEHVGVGSAGGIDVNAVVPAGASFTVRAIGPDDTSWVRRVLKQYWASHVVVSRGVAHDASKLPGFAAFRGDTAVGLITYHVSEMGAGSSAGRQCEIVTHNSLEWSGGIGSCLLAAVRQHARAEGCRRLWLVTTNDNEPALRFYQRREFDLVALHRHAVTESRRLKPEIPDVGLSGIPIRHELELEYPLD